MVPVNSSNEVAFDSDTTLEEIGPRRLSLLLRALVLVLCLLCLYGVALWMVVTVPGIISFPSYTSFQFYDWTECVFDEQTQSVVFVEHHKGTLGRFTVISVDTKAGRCYREAWRKPLAAFNCNRGTFQCTAFDHDRSATSAPAAVTAYVHFRSLPQLKKIGTEIQHVAEPGTLYLRDQLCKLSGNLLLVKELSSGKTLQEIDLGADTSVPSISRMDGSPLLLVSRASAATGQPLNSGPPIREHRLLSFEGGNLNEVFRWTGPWVGNYNFLKLSGDLFGTLDRSGQTIDVHSLQDFKPIRQIKGLAGKNIFVGNNWYRDDSQVYDLLSDKLLPVAGDERILARDAAQGRIAKTFNDGGVRGPASLIDETSGARLARLPKNTQRAWFVSEGKELLAVTWTGRILRYESRTGKLLKVIDPFAYARWLGLPMCLLFVLWVSAWLRTTSHLYDQAWIDLAIVTGVIVSLALMRPYFAGDPTDIHHFAYRIGQGVFAGWMFLVAMWLAMGRTRLSLRLVAPLVCMSLVALLALIAIGNTEPAFWGLIYGGTILCIVVALSWSYLRRRGWRLLRTASNLASEHPSPGEVSDGLQAQTKVRLGDLFIMTGVIACLAAVLRWAPGFGGLSPSIVPHLLDAFLVVSLLAIGLTAAFAALVDHNKDRTVLVRLLLIVLLATCLNYILFIAHYGRNGEPRWQPDLARYELLPFLFLSYTVYIGLLAYKSRGWRLQRV